MPYALRAKVETELSCLEDEGIVSKVEHSKWATPIVPVVKRNGLFQNSMVDAHSKWLEGLPVRLATSAKTIEVLRNLLVRFGILEQSVADNSSQFLPEEFQALMKVNSTKHITSAPYHSETNGLAVIAVQTIKQALHSTAGSAKPVEGKLAKFLITYRPTPHSMTGESSA